MRKMTSVEAMGPDDYESVRRAEQAIYERGWRKAFTANEMTRAWDGLVREVETGYDQVVEEYTNDLACRDWPALAWPMFTERVRAARQEELDSIDARFIAATTADSEGRLGRFFRVDGKDGWWWSRLPTDPRGEFAADLDT